VTKLGFVGVGRHAQKLAAVFRELGCDIVGHIRADGSPPAEGFGRLGDVGDADRLVICCPPKLAVAWAQTVGRPMLVSKPLLATDPAGLEHVSVDLWRLWSPAWVAFKQACAGRQINSLRVVFTGNGPFRETHSGALDYGPHAMAFVHDLLGDADTGYWSHSTYKHMGSGIWRWKSPPPGGVGPQVIAEFGNAAIERPEMFVEAHIGKLCYRWVERDEQHEFFAPNGSPHRRPRADALRAFCAAWLRNETAYTLQLSCMGMCALQRLEPLTRYQKVP
jgi:hypothetical protein